MTEPVVRNHLSQTDPVTVATKPTRSRGQSQWELIAREFGKRRLAVVAACVILSLVTISIFAPLIANDRPLYYVGFNRFEYQEAARTLRGAIGQLSELRSQAEPSPSKLKDLEQATRLQVSLMSSALPAEQSIKLRDLGVRLVQTLSKPDAVLVASELKSLQRELRSDFDGRDVTLVTRTHWPVLASMIWSDIVFLVANVLVLTWPIWTRILRRWGGSANDGASTGWYVAVMIGLPLACGLAWGSLVPQLVDRTNYK